MTLQGTGGPVVIAMALRTHVRGGTLGWAAASGTVRAMWVRLVFGISFGVGARVWLVAVGRSLAVGRRQGQLFEQLSKGSI